MAKKEKLAIGATNDYLSADFILDKNTVIIPASTALDIHLGGGIPEGSVVIISGDQKLGKTSLALKIGSNAQQLGRTIVYDNVEHRLKKMNLTGIKGLDTSAELFKLITSREGDMIGAEQHLERCEKALIEFPECVLIIDSLSSLSSNNQNVQKYGEGYGLEARKLETEFFKRIAPIISVNRNIVIGISHVMSNIGGMGKSEKMSGYTQYAQDVKLKISKAYGPNLKFEWLSGSRRVGHRVQWEIVNSALSSPGGKCIGYVRYGIGLDDTAELLDIASELDIVQKGGAWFTFPCGEKAQGFDGAYEFLSGNREEYLIIQQKVRELLL